jgi:hypothetical protein
MAPASPPESVLALDAASGVPFVEDVEPESSPPQPNPTRDVRKSVAPRNRKSGAVLIRFALIGPW